MEEIELSTDTGGQTESAVTADDPTMSHLAPSHHLTNHIISRKKQQATCWLSTQKTKNYPTHITTPTCLHYIVCSNIKQRGMYRITRISTLGLTFRGRAPGTSASAVCRRFLSSPAGQNKPKIVIIFGSQTVREIESGI